MFHSFFCIQNQWFLSICGACSEIVCAIKWGATYFSSLRAQLILAPLGMPKWAWPSVNWYRMFFVQTSTLPQHAPKIYRSCMQKNQLLTDRHVELDSVFMSHQWNGYPRLCASYFSLINWNKDKEEYWIHPASYELISKKLILKPHLSQSNWNMSILFQSDLILRDLDKVMNFWGTQNQTHTFSRGKEIYCSVMSILVQLTTDVKGPWE